MLLWQPKILQGMLKKLVWHNFVQKEKSETRLRAVTFRFLTFSFPLVPLLLLWTQAVLWAQLCTWKHYLQLIFHARGAPMGALPHPFWDEQQIPSVPGILPKTGDRAFAWKILIAALWERAGEDRWGWCCYSFFQHSSNWSEFLLWVCLSGLKI